MNENKKLKLLADFGEIKLGQQHKQGYCVYHSEGLCSSITARGGGIGRYAGLYVVREHEDTGKFIHRD